MKTLLVIIVAAFAFSSGCDASDNPNNSISPVGNTHKIEVEVLAEGLVNPWSIAFLPDGSMLIAERPGILRFFRDGQLSDPINGLPPIWQNGQGGLLEVALHPDYESNGWIYFAYASSDDGRKGNTAIGRGKLQGNAIVDFETLFRGSPLTDLPYHFGCRIVFDEQNNIYFPIGDRGEMDNAQKLSNHNGKLMRLKDDGSIPPDNPFVDESAAMPEIFNYGHRNIQGMAIHPESGEIWTHEHGPRGGDEINIEKAGANYGWPVVTFGINYDGTVISNDTTLPGITDPVHYWVPSIAPCGMAFVTSDKYPNWKNNLMVTALAGQQIQRLSLSGSQVVATEILLQGYARFRDIRQGPDGYLYVLSEGPGQLIRLKPLD